MWDCLASRIRELRASPILQGRAACLLTSLRFAALAAFCRLTLFTAISSSFRSAKSNCEPSRRTQNAPSQFAYIETVPTKRRRQFFVDKMISKERRVLVQIPFSIHQYLSETRLLENKGASCHGNYVVRQPRRLPRALQLAPSNLRGGRDSRVLSVEHLKCEGS